MTSEEFRNNPLFLRNQFKGDGVFEIPKIEKEEINLENIKLIGYDKLNEKTTDKIVYFFLDTIAECNQIILASQTLNFCLQYKNFTSAKPIFHIAKQYFT